MPVSIRIAHLKLVNVVGDTVVEKDNANTKLRDVLRASTEFRVIPNGTGAAESPNSSGHPTVEAYLEAEAGDNHALAYIDQTRIITQEIT